MIRLLMPVAGLLALCLSLSAQAQQAVEVKGKIKTISAADGQFVLTDNDGKDWTILVTENTKIELNGKKCSITDLRVGDDITIPLSAKNDDSQSKDSLRIKDAGEGGNPKDAHDKQDRNRASAEDQKRTLDELNRLSKALKSDDPKTREEAQRKLDELAERAAKQLGQEQLQKDLESKDPAVRQKAQEKLQQELAKHVAKQLGQHQLQKELESSDPAVRQKAMEKLADAMRQQREKEQQENQQRRALEELDRLSKALKSDDPQTGEEAQRKLDNLAKQLAKQLGQEQLQKDLQSNDPATRQKALEKLQQELAKQVAKNLGQEQLQKELESNDPAVRQKALDKLNQLMKQRPEKDDGGQANVPGSGGRTEDALGPGDSEGGDEANPANRKKAFELQLEELKKKLTPDMLKKLNMTEKERDEFLKACEEALKRMPSGPGGKETLPKSQEARGQSSGVRPVDPKNKGPRDNLENAGSASAPPEYRNASKDFSEELAKRKKNREKK